ncbi:MAG TPA: DUF4142 domain-containing protein [Burkholderiales bacterium]|jgi:putative membrane protein|nr:DUF4142 domain-containing protein [Burkholderiales bacterium]
MKKTGFPSRWLLAAACAFAAVPAHAQMLGGASKADDSRVARADVRWMEKAARVNAGEIEAGKLATGLGQRDEVRAFGKTMAEQYGRANDELNAIAAQKRVVLLNRPDGAHHNQLLKLAALSGDAFDRAYVRSAGIDDHTDAAKLFEDGIANLRDPDLKAYAGRTLADIKHHFEMLREISPLR